MILMRSSSAWIWRANSGHFARHVDNGNHGLRRGCPCYSIGLRIANRPGHYRGETTVAVPASNTPFHNSTIRNPSSLRSAVRRPLGDSCPSQIYYQRSAILQCRGSPHPTGTVSQPESRLPGLGHGNAVAAARFIVLSRWILQYCDRTTCAPANSLIEYPRVKGFPFRLGGSHPKA